MQEIDEPRLEHDLEYRYEYLKEFVGFGPDDVAAIRETLALLAPIIPEIVDESYKTLLSNTATARHFVPRQSGFQGNAPESIEALSISHEQIQFRKDHLQRYLMNLLGHSYDSKVVKFFDVTARIHTPNAGNPNINVPLVQMNAFMGRLSDILTDKILGLEIEADAKLRCLRAFHKILWLQNDFICRQYQEPATPGE
jgi:hypothetical protein